MSDVRLAPAARPSVDSAAIRRQIVALAWPVVLQALLRTVLFLTDTVMLGFLSTEAVATMAAVSPMAHTLNMVLAAIGTAALATVARATGAKDEPLREREAATALVVAAAAGVILLATIAPFFPLLAGLFHVKGDPTSGPAAREYLGWVVFAVPFMLLDGAAAGILRGSGDTRTPLVAAVLANAVNILGNYVFIFGKWGAPALGVAGAGLSTALAMAVEGTFLALWLFGPRSALRLRVASFATVTRDSVRRLARIAVPAAVEPLLFQGGFLLFIILMTGLGVGAMAAHRGALALESISFMPGWAVSIACGALVGQYLGERLPDHAAAAFRQAALMAVATMSALGVVFAIFPDPLFGLLISKADPEVRAVGVLCLRISAIEQPLMAVAFVLGGALRGAGDTRSPVLVALAGIWCVRVPLSYLFAFTLGWGIAGAWVAMVLDWSTRAAVFAWVWRRGKLRTLKL